MYLIVVCFVDILSFLPTASVVVDVPYVATAIVRHVGSSFHQGHCTALARKTTACDSPWILFNDGKVKEISHKEVVTKEAHMIVFRRQDSLSEASMNICPGDMV